jgi:single-strand DNA-binding protein
MVDPSAPPGAWGGAPEVNETIATIVGNIATDLRSSRSKDGVPMASFRIASTTRRFERGKGWSDVDTLFVTVVCWRQLAEHVALSFGKGDPVIVSGRLRMRQWTGDDGRSGTAFELEAQSAGHDLTRGVSSFARAHSRRSADPAPESNTRESDAAQTTPVELVEIAA